MKRLSTILFFIISFNAKSQVIADTIYYDNGSGGYTKVVTYRNYPTTSFWPKTDTVNSGTLMTKWNATAAIATLQSSIDGKVSLSGSYSNPSWLTSLAWSKISGAPDFLTLATLPLGKADNATEGIVSFDSSYFNDNGSGLITWALNTGTGSVSASAVTINSPRGKITYTSPSIVAAGTASITLTNSFITSTSVISVGINGNGSNLISINCYIKSQTNGSCVVNIQNLSLLSLFNSSLLIDYLVVN